MVADDRGALLEREAQLERLTAAIDDARAGVGSTVAVEGPAGIGKTRLLEATRELAAAAGLSVLSASAGELEQELGWAVVRELFEPALQTLSDEERAQVHRGAARLALPALGHNREMTLPPGADGLAAALHGLYWLTATLAERGPIVVAIDDAHWADEPSRRWLAYMAPRIADLPVAIVITARLADPGATRDIVGSLGARRPVTIIRPAALSEPAIARCVRGALGARAEDGFCKACAQATAGNPFLIGELLGELAATGVVPVDVNVDRVRDAGPETVARAVVSRITALGAPALALATAVAVLGSEAQLGDAALLAGLDERTAAVAADRLADADVLRAGLPLEFMHPLVRAAVYEREPKAQLALHHAHASRLLAERGADDDQIARHLLAVEPGGDPEIVARLQRAAARLLAQGAPSVAATYLQRALDEPAPDDLRPELMHRLGQAQTASMGAAGLDTLEAAVELCPDPSERAAIALELSHAARMVADYSRAARVLERALEALDSGTPLATRVDGELVNIAFLDLDSSLAAQQRLLRYFDPAVLDGLQEPSVLADLALVTVAAIGPREVAVELARRAVREMAGKEPDPSAIVFAGSALMYCEEFADALALWDGFVASARSSGSALAFAFGTWFRAHVVLRLGDVRAAEDDARTALAIFDEWQAATVPPPSFLADALTEQGALREASELLGTVPPAELRHIWDNTQALHTRGRIRLAQGRLADAVRDLEEAGARLGGFTESNPTVLSWRSDAAIAHAGLGDRERALALVGEEVELARRFGAPRALGIALRAAGVIEGGQRGIELLGDAVDVLARSGARVEHARALCDLGSALRRAGRRAEARDPLRQALDLATSTGARAIADRARGELVTAGARPRRDRIEGRDALTASERRVAALAADGLSNPEIAQSLFVARRTVETHLTHVYRKLDVSSRAELEAALGRVD